MAGITTQRPDELIEVLSGDFLTNHGWADFTPTVVQGGAVAATVTFARYIVLAQTVIAQARLAITAAGVAGNAVRISGFPTAILPTGASSSTHVVGNILIQDTGTAVYHGAFTYEAANDFRGRAHNTGNNIGITPNFALANGDFIGFQGAWER